jgi:hypothetical protein
LVEEITTQMLLRLVEQDHLNQHLLVQV